MGADHNELRSKAVQIPPPLTVTAFEAGFKWGFL